MRFRPSLKQFVMRISARGGLLSLVALTGVIGASPVTTVAYAAGTTQNYLVVFKASHIPAGQAAKFQAAAGQVIASYDQIGVAVVSSDNANFRAAMLADSRIRAAALDLVNRNGVSARVFQVFRVLLARLMRFCFGGHLQIGGSN